VHRASPPSPTRRSSDLIAIPVLLTVEEDEGPGTGEPGPEEPGPEEPGPEEPGIEDPEEPADEWQEPDPAFRFGDVPEGHVFEYRSEEHTSELQSRENLV